jgi:hypothetical protein
MVLRHSFEILSVKRDPRFPVSENCHGTSEFQQRLLQGRELDTYGSKVESLSRSVFGSGFFSAIDLFCGGFPFRAT